MTTKGENHKSVIIVYLQVGPSNMAASRFSASLPASIFAERETRVALSSPILRSVTPTPGLPDPVLFFRSVIQTPPCSFARVFWRTSTGIFLGEPKPKYFKYPSAS